MTRTRNVSDGKVVVGAKQTRNDSRREELPNFSLSSVDSARDLANVVDFMRRMGVSELRIGKLGLALAPDWAPRAVPVDDIGEVKIEATRADSDELDPYSDPDLYPDGQVPSFDED